MKGITSLPDVKTIFFLNSKNGEITLYEYKNSLPHAVVLPGGDRLRYEYDEKAPNPAGPVAEFYKSGAGEWPVMEYLWLDGARLAACVDYQTGLQYEFTYKDDALLRVRLRGHAVQRLCRTGGNEAELLVGCDRKNTPKVFADTRGREIKSMDYDRFGAVLEDSLPELFIPVGFAGGLASRYAGVIRFGSRDYDPFSGRFACPGVMKKNAGGNESRGPGDPGDFPGPPGFPGMGSPADRLICKGSLRRRAALRFPLPKR